jgi:hypothetical protein
MDPPTKTASSLAELMSVTRSLVTKVARHQRRRRVHWSNLHLKLRHHRGRSVVNTLTSVQPR